MAQKSRPDPTNGNVVSADEYEAIALSFGEDGIYGSPSAPPVVYADSTGRQVKVRAGKLANIRGYSWQSDPITDEIINNSGAGLPANTSGNPRIDRLVLRLDRSNRTIRTVYLQGTPAVTPAAPALTQSTSLTSGFWDFPLARWNVANGYTTVAAADIVNEAWYRGLGGNVLCNSDARPFGAYLQDGFPVLDVDTRIPRMWDGAGWRMTAPYRDKKIVTTSTPTVSFTNIPKTLREVRVVAKTRTDYAAAFVDWAWQVNDIAGTNYRLAHIFEQNAAAPAGVARNLNATSGRAGAHPGASALNPNLFGTAEMLFQNWDNTLGWLSCQTTGGYVDGSSDVVAHGVSYVNTGGPYTKLTFITNGNFITGSTLTLQGWE